MGRVKPGAFSEKQLSVKNLGDAPLVIERVITSCPCATVTPITAGGATVPAGESIDLTVRYTPDQDPAGGGAALVIYSNDPELPVLVTDLRVFIDQLVALSPPDGIYWGLAPRGFPLSKELIIAPGDIGKNIDLLSVAANVQGITIESQKVERPDGRFIRLTFALGADLPLGTLDARLTARVRVGDEVTDLSIPFRGGVLGDLLLMPPAIISPKTDYAQGQKISEITVSSSSGGMAPSIVGAMAVGPLRAVINQPAGFDRHVIGVYAAENAPGGPQSATVYVMTTSKDEPIVSVPVYFRMGSPVACEPDRLVLHEHSGAREIRIRPLTGGSVSVKNLRYEPDSLRADIIQADGQEGSGQPAIVSVRPAAGLSPEKRSTILVVETDVAGAERITIPVLVLP